MNDDLVVFGFGFDQSIPTERDSLEVREFVDQKIDDAIQTGDLNKATGLVRGLIKLTKISSRELVRVLYKLKKHWDSFGTTESFEEWADRESGLHKHTIERYIRVDALLDDPEIPSEIRKELADKNLAELFPIANMHEQGYEPTRDEWEEIISQPDEVSIRAAVREVKNTAPRPTALGLSIDENGSVWATKDNVRKFVGSLELTDDSAIVQQAIERIIKNTGILKWL